MYEHDSKKKLSIIYDSCLAIKNNECAGLFVRDVSLTCNIEMMGWKFAEISQKLFWGWWGMLMYCLNCFIKILFQAWQFLSVIRTDSQGNIQRKKNQKKEI